MDKFTEMLDVHRENMLDICKKHGLTIPKIAKVIKVSPTTIYKYLNMGKIPRKLMNQICEVLFEIPKQEDEEQNPIFPIYTADLIRARFYLVRALNKMDEIYLKTGGQTENVTDNGCGMARPGSRRRRSAERE